MKHLIPILILCVLPAQATIAIAHRYNVTAFNVTVTSTTAGNNFYLYTDASVVPASVQFTGGGTFTKYACLPVTTISTICFWYLENIAAGRTAISCTTCGTVFAVHAWEISGAETSNSIDHAAPCSAPGSICFDDTASLFYHPGYSAEAVLYAGNCTGSAASPFVTGTGVTWTGAGPNGEPGADGVVSTNGVITASADSGCGGNGAVIIGIRQLSSSQSCTADLGYYDYGAELSSTGNPTVTAIPLIAGDLIAVSVWGISGITVTGVTVGSDTATAIGTTGTSNANSGQPFIYYVLSNSAAGSQTITATITGTRTHSQVAYMEFIHSQGCTFSHGVDASLGTGTGATANTPSITATAGSVLYNFTAVETHATAVNSPWTCHNYMGTPAQPTESNSCFLGSTVNAQAFSLSATGSAQANNISQLSSGAWEALLTEFKLIGTASATVTRGKPVMF